eukprot:Hpha_TRINITY_DN14992_c0_g1::TRINITY_DN14992_c0_g1_i1::g.144899::m.144899
MELQDVSPGSGASPSATSRSPPAISTMGIAGAPAGPGVLPPGTLPPVVPPGGKIPEPDTEPATRSSPLSVGSCELLTTEASSRQLSRVLAVQKINAGLTVVTVVLVLVVMAVSAATLGKVNCGDALLVGGVSVEDLESATSAALRAGRVGTWLEIHPIGREPEPRLAHAAASVHHHLYIHGGFYGNQMGGTPYGDLWRYDEVSDEWEEIHATGDIPSVRLHHSMLAVDDDTLLLYGGFNTFMGLEGHDSLDDLYKFDIPSKRWTRLD